MWFLIFFSSDAAAFRIFIIRSLLVAILLKAPSFLPSLYSQLERNSEYLQESFTGKYNLAGGNIASYQQKERLKYPIQGYSKLT